MTSQTTSIRPRPDGVEGLVRPPGSKSITNRALVLAGLAAGGASRLYDPLDADDTVVMRRALRAFGVLIDDVDEPWLILGTGGDLELPPAVVDVGASGTSARFLTAMAALAPGPVVIDGTERMQQRPISELTDALQALGATVHTNGGCPPVRIEGTEISGGRVTIDGSRSSQFVSALLMLAPMLGAPTEIEVAGGDLVSRPYVAGTVEVMEHFGADVDVDGDRYIVAPTGYRKAELHIEADASAAAYPLVAAAITGGVVGVVGVPPGSIQPDTKLIDVLQQMGCVVVWDDQAIRLIGPERLQAVDVDMNDAPDAAMALAVACLFAQGGSRIRNIGNLRLKETDRLAALVTEIRRLGGGADVAGDDLIVTPGDLHPAVIQTYDDHRMAMSFSLAGLRVPGIEIADPDCVSKTWPGFFDMLETL